MSRPYRFKQPYRLSKYHARKTEVDGITFDSRKEANRWTELRLMEKAGMIRNLERQKRYELTPAQRDPETGKVIERASYYVADFVYEDEDGNTVVEDSKGLRTDVYILKRKIMLARYGIRIKET